MSDTINREATPDGIKFGPTTSGKMYLCYKEHRGAGDAGDKSVWDIDEVEEYNLFSHSDDQNWVDSNNDYWAVRPNGSPLGKKGEILAKFWDRSPWHGFPIFTNKTQVPKPIVKLWQDSNVITRALAKRIKKMKV